MDDTDKFLIERLREMMAGCRVTGIEEVAESVEQDEYSRKLGRKTITLRVFVENSLGVVEPDLSVLGRSFGDTRGTFADTSKTFQPIADPSVD